ncbi:MAG: response regulator, partial [Elusimicrobiota bacterium]
MSADATPEKKAVICDDDRMLAHIMGHMLTKLGFEVLKGENGYEAVAMVHFHKPRLLILDVEMPAKDGFSVLADLQ